MKGRDVTTADIPGAFLQTNYDKGDINIKMKGEMVTIIDEIDPAYYKEFIYKYIRGKKCMYEESNNPIYGTLDSSLLFWTKP